MKEPRVRIVYAHWIFRLPWMRPYRGICVGRRILFRDPEGRVPGELLAHEMIHQDQITRHGVLPFYLAYVRDYLINLARYRNHDRAYRNIPFEREAFAANRPARTRGNRPRRRNKA